MFSVLNTIINTSIGTVAGINGVYDEGSYPEGEKTVNGRQVLVYSPIATKYGPIHAHNTARGFYKIKSEFINILMGAFITNFLAQAATSKMQSPFRKYIVQMVGVTIATYCFGCYRGMKPIGIPRRDYDEKQTAKAKN